MSELGEKLIGIVRAKAQASPDFVYKSPVAHQDGYDNVCVYVHGGCPSCIVGHALWDAGLIDASFEASEDNSSGINFSVAIPALFELTESERKWLAAVQQRQDIGYAWSRAVDEADEIAPLN